MSEAEYRMLGARIASRLNELRAQGLVGQSDGTVGGIIGGVEGEEIEKKYQSHQWRRHLRHKD